ncbi:serine/threonine-protein kinase [Streptomyces sp. M19]
MHDFGEYEGALYLVMELLEGATSARCWRTARDPLPVADVIDIAAQLADALAYTHEQGIVHRDLKPANIIRLSDATVKICDFGIARIAHDIGFTARLAGAGTGITMGTPHYMSPEQIAGVTVDHRSDLYSLGCVLYELATGAPPFDLGTPGPCSSATATPRRSRRAAPARTARLPGTRRAGPARQGTGGPAARRGRAGRADRRRPRRVGRAAACRCTAGPPPARGRRTTARADSRPGRGT